MSVKPFDRYLPIALCLLFSTSSSFRFMADSVSDLELLDEVSSRFNLAAVLLAFPVSSTLLLELFAAGWTRAHPLAELLLRVLQ